MLEGRAWCEQTWCSPVLLSLPAQKAVEAVKELMWAGCTRLIFTKEAPSSFQKPLFLCHEKFSVNGPLPCARCSENWELSQAALPAGDLLTQRSPWNCCPSHLSEFWIRPLVPAGLWLQLSLQMMPWNWTICSWELIPLKSIIPDPWSCSFSDGRLASESQLCEITPFPSFSETRFFFYYYTIW